MPQPTSLISYPLPLPLVHQVPTPPHSFCYSSLLSSFPSGALRLLLPLAEMLRGWLLLIIQVSVQMPPSQRWLPRSPNLELDPTHCHPDVVSSQHISQSKLSDQYSSGKEHLVLYCDAAAAPVPAL